MHSGLYRRWGGFFLVENSEHIGCTSEMKAGNLEFNNLENKLEKLR